MEFFEIGDLYNERNAYTNMISQILLYYIYDMMYHFLIQAMQYALKID